jgi:tyrosinase
MPTSAVKRIAVTNAMGGDVSIYLAHALGTSRSVHQGVPPPLPDGLTRTEYPRSVLYQGSLTNRESRSVTVEVETGAGAAMDYWAVAVFLPREPGPNSVFTTPAPGTLLLPVWGAKIPDDAAFEISIVPLPPNTLSVVAKAAGVIVAQTAMDVDPTGQLGFVPSVRQAVSGLTPADRAAYVSAVKALKRAPSQLTPPTRSRYDDYVFVHMLAMQEISVGSKSVVENGNITLRGGRMPMWAHEGPVFVPWHRVFLWQFERDLHVLGGYPLGKGIPYWDWDMPNNPPDRTPWVNDLMGDDGHDGPVPHGPFADVGNWPITLGGDTSAWSSEGTAPLVRGFGLLSRMPNPDERTATLAAAAYDTQDGSSDPSTFRSRLEGLHNMVHRWVAGHDGTMLQTSSPNDPAFFLHHSNVDRFWVQWQYGHAGALPQDPPFYAPTDKIAEPLIFMDKTSSTPPWPGKPVTPGDVVSHYALSYCYDFELEVGI